MVGSLPLGLSLGQTDANQTREWMFLPSRTISNAFGRLVRCLFPAAFSQRRGCPFPGVLGSQRSDRTRRFRLGAPSVSIPSFEVSVSPHVGDRDRDVAV